MTLSVIFGGLFAYRHLEGNITSLDTEDQLGERPDKVDVGEPLEPLNILLLGSDTREGQSGNIGGETPGLSDTTILLHLSADRKRAYGVSLPRDAMVERPECVTDDGATVPGELAMFNTAYALGGPACTQRTVEQLTGVRVDHFVVVEFDGFRHMVDALGGIPICVPEEVNDDIGKIYLPAGSYEADGDQALDYVRLRHGLSENGDIGRMKRQQVFLATMANKAISAGTLANPVKLYNFLDAATKSLTTDPELANLKELGGLANQLRNIGLDKIQFLTVPWETYEVLALRATPELGVAYPSAVAVQPSPGTDVATLVGNLNDAFPDLEALTREDAVDTAPGRDSVRMAFMVVIGLGYLVVAVVIGFFFLTLTLQKEPAITLLRAVGSPQGYLVRGLILQVAVVTVGGLLIGVALAYAAAPLLNDTIPVTIEPRTLGMSALSAMGVALLGAVSPVRRVLRADPYTVVSRPSLGGLG